MDYTKINENKLPKSLENAKRSLAAIVDEMAIGPGKARFFAQDLVNAYESLRILEEIDKARAPKKKAAVKQD